MQKQHTLATAAEGIRPQLAQRGLSAWCREWKEGYFFVAKKGLRLAVLQEPSVYWEDA